MSTLSLLIRIVQKNSLKGSAQFVICLFEFGNVRIDVIRVNFGRIFNHALRLFELSVQTLAKRRQDECFHLWKSLECSLKKFV